MKARHTSETLTVRLTSETKAKLVELAQQTRRTRSVLAGEAIEAYVDRELAIVAAIHRGLDDMEAGRVVPHDEAMKRIRQTIELAPKHISSPMPCPATPSSFST